MLEVALVGLPASGKSTLLKALAGPDHAHPSSEGQVVVRVEDPRLEPVAAVFRPKEVAPLEMRFREVAATDLGLGGHAPSTAHLQALAAEADVLGAVVRAFADETVPHIEGSVDPERDMALLNLELAALDVALVDLRLKRIADSLKAAKASERAAGERERAILAKLKTALEEERGVRSLGLTLDEHEAIRHYQFLSAKPLLFLINLGEEQTEQAEGLARRLAEVAKGPGVGVHALCAKLEAELAEMEKEEARQFRRELGLGAPAAQVVAEACLSLAGRVTFFTGGPKEVRAWQVPLGTAAPQAAGVVHSDMERGFIRAEVISWDQLAQYGSLAEARRHGALRTEGRGYHVQDGDVIHFLFSV